MIKYHFKMTAYNAWGLSKDTANSLFNGDVRKAESLRQGIETARQNFKKLREARKHHDAYQRHVQDHSAQAQSMNPSLHQYHDHQDGTITKPPASSEKTLLKYVAKGLAIYIGTGVAIYFAADKDNIDIATEWAIANEYVPQEQMEPFQDFYRTYLPDDSTCLALGFFTPVLKITQKTLGYEETQCYEDSEADTNLEIPSAP